MQKFARELLPGLLQIPVLGVRCKVGTFMFIFLGGLWAGTYRHSLEEQVRYMIGRM